MTRFLRNAAVLSAGVLTAASIGMVPAAADVSQPPTPATITVPADATEAPPELMPFFTPTGMAAVPPDDPAAPVAVLADQLRAAATLPQVMNNVRDWIIGLLSGLATVLVTIGGLRYLLAGGNESEVMKAKGALKSAAYGYALAVLAPVLVDALKSMVGAS
ncbi:pilin [Catenulispora pinisilvae]|uniref:pilin n=1 Tax=Catenulispora pinisilvae TaxID=2705253 RepID=UPI001E3AD3BF|nr:pilin [Catenulispora pinisilvae]